MHTRTFRLPPRLWTLLVLPLASLFIAGAALAHDHDDWRHDHGKHKGWYKHHHHHPPRPVVVAPAPAVVVPSAPVVVAPAPVYAAPVVAVPPQVNVVIPIR